MSSKDSAPPRFERDELGTLLQAPLYIVLAVLLNEDTDPVQFLQRLRSGAAILVQAQQQQATFGSLTTSFATLWGSPLNATQLKPDELASAREYELLELVQQFKDADEGRTRAIALCAQVVDILALRVPYPQAQAYCNWLLSVAQSVVEATAQEGSADAENSFYSPGTAVVTELRAALVVPPYDS